MNTDIASRASRHVRFALLTLLGCLAMVSVATTRVLHYDPSICHSVHLPKPDPDRLEIEALAGHIAGKYRIEQALALQITEAAYRESNERDVAPALVLALIGVESSYRPRVTHSSSGAAGLMQVMARWHPEKIKAIGGVENLREVDANIKVGTWIIDEYLRREKGRLNRALGRYWGSQEAEEYVKKVRSKMNRLSEIARRASEGVRV